MARKTDIRLRRSDTAGKIPTSANLSDGELALNTNSGALYFKKSNGTIITVHDNTILHIDSDTTVDSETGSNPKVGIGTTSPGYKLDVNGQIHGTSAYIDGYIYHTGDSDTYINYSTDTIILSAGAQQTHFKGNGRVGLGVSSPTEKLHVTSGTVNTAVARFTGANNDRGLVISTAVSGITNDSIINYDAVSTNSVGQHAFKTDGTERVRITASGNVGVGTNSPATNFHISESSDQTSPQLRITNDNSESLTIGVVRSVAGTAPDTALIQFDNALRFIGQTGTTNERMRITEAGNVGINTTNPGYKLDVGGSVRFAGSASIVGTLQSYSGVFNVKNIAQDQDLNLQVNDGGTNTTALTVQGTTANVGIGTTSPDAQLEVENSGTGRIAISGTTGANLQFRPNTSYTAGGNFGIYTTGLTSGTYESTMTIKGYGSGVNNVMTIKGLGKVGIGTTTPLATLHVGSASGSLNSSAELFIPAGDALMRTLKIGHGSSTASITTDDSSKPITFTAGGSEKVRITNDGKVGIGTNSPANLLSVESTGQFAGINIKSASSNGISYLDFGDADDNNIGGINYDNSTNTLQLRNNNTHYVFLKSSGNVGIGTGSPTRKLHVSGSGATVGIKIEATDGSQASVDLTNTEGAVRLINDGGAFQIYDDTDTAQRLHISTAGAITFNNAFTFPNSIGSAGQVLKVPNSGTDLIWADQTGGGGSTDSIADADDDTKIQVEESADEDIIRFDTAGSQRMVILANGNVGINNNSPSAKLTANGSTLLNLPSSSNTFRIQDSQNNVERFRVTQAGNVGIGTTNPDVKLHLEDSSRVDIKFEKTGSETHYIRKDGDYLRFRGHDDSTVLFELQNNTNGSNVSAFPNGNVGIGTSAPSDKLTVVGNTTLSGDGRHIYFGGSNTFVGENSNSNRLELRGGGSGTSQTVYIDNSGKVGIGQNVPQAKLHVIHNDISEALLLESTVDGSSAAPLLTFKRNCSDSGADADYLGQLKFKGENDAGEEIVYGKITAKIQDASDGTEDGLIEFANKKAGSNVITARLRSDSLQLLNGTSLSVAGDATITGNLTVDGTTTTLNTATLDVEDKNITLNYGSGDTSATADGAGITIQDAVDSSTNATILWDGTNDEFDFSHAINTAGAITAQRIIGTQTNGSSLYALELTRSGGGTTTPDLYGTNSTLVLGSSASTEALAFSSADSFFYGELNVPSKIKHSGDSDNYFSFAAADTQSFVTGNSTRLQITNSLVRLNQEGLNQDFQVFGENIDNLLYVDASTDRVGIGTATPTERLHVEGNIEILNNGYIGSLDGNYWQRLRFEDDTPSATNAFNFETRNGSGSFINHMTITNNGDVGIGDTTPTARLNVNSGTENTIALFESSDSLGRLIIKDSSGEVHLNNVGNDFSVRTSSAGSTKLTVKGDTGNVGIGEASPKAKLQVEELGIDTTETTTSATTQVTLASLSITDFRSARFTIQVTNSTDSTYHTTELLAVHDGTTAYITEFGEIHTGSAEEATFDAAITSGFFRLQATPASTDTMVFKVVSYAITV